MAQSQLPLRRIGCPRTRHDMRILRVVCISGRHKSRFIQIGIYYGVGGRLAYPAFSRALCMIIRSSKSRTIRVDIASLTCYLVVLLFDPNVVLLLVMYVIPLVARDSNNFKSRYSGLSHAIDQAKCTRTPQLSLKASPRMSGPTVKLG